MACKKGTPYWSKDSRVYHVCKNCTVGNNIEPDKLRSGRNTGKRRQCLRCAAIIAGSMSR